MSPNTKAVIALGVGTLAAFFAAFSALGLGAVALAVMLYPHAAAALHIGDYLPSIACVIIGIPLAVVMFRYRRTMRRMIAGKCVTCGYDLRESADRCPECGTPIRRQMQISDQGCPR